MENLIKKKDYDLKIKFCWGKELRIYVPKNTEYMEIESNHPDIWIARAKDVIKSYENQKITKTIKD